MKVDAGFRGGARAFREHTGSRPNNTIIFADKKVQGMGVAHHDIILEIKEFVAVGGVGGFMETFVENIGIRSGVAEELDIILRDFLRGKLGDAGYD